MRQMVLTISPRLFRANCARPARNSGLWPPKSPVIAHIIVNHDGFSIRI
jgi:hypothetical protein